MKKEALIKRIARKLFILLGIIETKEISKSEMCKNAQNICNHDCEICAWNDNR